MTLHLTDAERQQLDADGQVVLFRDGELPYGDPCPCGRGEHPPVEFVEAAKPCETCGGDGIIVDGGGRIMNHRVNDRWIDCPADCLDGKRRIAAVVSCDCAETDTWCQHGWPDGTVTVGHVVVEWGACPVIHWDDQVRIATLDEFVVVGSPTDPTWAAHYVRGDDIGRRMGRFTLPPGIDPQSLVGQYALGIRKVDQ